MKTTQRFLASMLLVATLLCSLVCKAGAKEIAADGAVERVAGEAVDWIDRVELPISLRVLYDTLVEGADGDGENDILIEDTYLNDPDYKILVATETVEVGDRSLGEIRDEIFARYEPFLYAVFSAFDRDCPEVFWLNGKWSVGSNAQRQGSRCTVEIVVGIHGMRSDAYANARAIREAIVLREAAIARVMRTFDVRTTNYEKIVAFNDFLTKQNEYNTMENPENAPSESYESISALIGRSGMEGPICEGYAKAFKVLCDAAQISCVLVDGVAVNSVGSAQSHMWNYVYLQGAWYAVDVTWNDPMGGRAGALSGVESEKWLLLGADSQVGGRSFLQSHPVRNLVYPDQVSFPNGPSLSRTAWQSTMTVALDLPSEGYIYNGTEQKPTVIVKDGHTVLREGRDYTVEYVNCINAGEATVCIKGKGSYAGEIVEGYTIAPKPIVPRVEISKKIYDGDRKVQIVLTLDEEALAWKDRAEVRVAEVSAQTESADAAKAVPLTIQASLTGAESENYRLVLPLELSVDILPREIRILADQKELSMSDTEVDLTYTVDESTPLVEGDRLQGALSLGEKRKDGSYPIVQGSLTDENNPNYRITFVGADVTREGVSSETLSDQVDFEGSMSELSDFPENRLWIVASIGIGALIFVVAIAIILKKKK